MSELIALNMAPIMFASLVVFLLFGYPVAFALAANGLLFFVIGVELAPLSGGTISLDWPLLIALPERFWGVMSNETLLAVPFFTFMGIVLERSGMAEDLLDTIGQLFGPIRGGLAYAVVFVGALLAATTGVTAASVIAMGLISLPIMLRYGYDRKISSGVITASGTLAQIIPPSLVLIVLADQLGRSVGDMYTAALIPGLTLAGLYMAWVLILSIVRPGAMPALPVEARTLGSGLMSLVVALAAAVVISYAAYSWLEQREGSANAEILGASIGVLAVYTVAVLDRALKLNAMSRLAQQVVIVLIPPLALIFLVLGTIFLGIATPTEGGAMGAVGAVALAAAKRRLTMDVIRHALAATTRLSSFVMFILLGARVFSLTFYGVNGHIWVEHLLTSLPGGQVGFLVVVSTLVFLLAFFLDFFELAFIIIPLLAPAAEKLGIDLIWFGVILGVNMQTSFLHPPFGFALFYLRSVAPREAYIDRVTGEKIAGVTTGQIYWGAIPFVCIQILMIGLVVMFPAMVMHYKGAPVNIEDVKITIPPALGGNNGGLPGLGGPLGGGMIGLPPIGGQTPAPGGGPLQGPPPIGGQAPAPGAGALQGPPPIGGQAPPPGVGSLQGPPPIGGQAPPPGGGAATQ